LVTTVVDSNVLIAIWDVDPRMNEPARMSLEAALEEGHLVCPAPVYSELMASPGRDEEFLDTFFQDSGISLEWHLSEAVWRAAGIAYQGYAKRRRRNLGGEPRRILADFLIGAYASHLKARLLTLDQKAYRAAFPKLTLLPVERYPI
jgi:predicted nucleic acid-binding protein